MMSYTKYVMGADDKFALISKMTGVEHSQLAGEIGGADKVLSAGFLYQDDAGVLVSYGKSFSLSIDSNSEDGPIILAAINRGEVKILEDLDACVHFATNSGSTKSTNAPTATLALLQEYRILERD